MPGCLRGSIQITNKQIYGFLYFQGIFFKINYLTPNYTNTGWLMNKVRQHPWLVRITTKKGISSQWGKGLMDLAFYHEDFPWEMGKSHIVCAYRNIWTFTFCCRITVLKGMKSNGFAQCKQRVQVKQVLPGQALSPHCHSWWMREQPTS